MCNSVKYVKGSKIVVMKVGQGGRDWLDQTGNWKIPVLANGKKGAPFLPATATKRRRTVREMDEIMHKKGYRRWNDKDRAKNRHKRAAERVPAERKSA